VHLGLIPLISSLCEFFVWVCVCGIFLWAMQGSVARPSTAPRSSSVVDDILEAVVGVSKSQAIARKAEEAVLSKADKLSNR